MNSLKLNAIASIWKFRARDSLEAMEIEKHLIFLGRFIACQKQSRRSIGNCLVRQIAR
jgi:hypothetical protein